MIFKHVFYNISPERQRQIDQIEHHCVLRIDISIESMFVLTLTPKKKNETLSIQTIQGSYRLVFRI